MTVQGHVQGGVVVFDEPSPLPEGSAVEVRLIQQASRSPQDDDPLRKYAGIATDLPPDASVSIDHVLYGTPAS